MIPSRAFRVCEANLFPNRETRVPRAKWLGQSKSGPDRHEGTLDALQETIMKAIFSKLVRDEQGGEVLEYALIMGLIVVASIAVIGTVGGKVLARWQSVNSSM